jgi:hypothetical protein
VCVKDNIKYMANVIIEDIASIEEIQMFNKKLKQLNSSKHAISTLVIALIIIIIVGSVAVVVVVAVLLGLWHPYGLIVGSGELVTEEKDFTDFTIVEVGWGFEVEISGSDSYSMNITADDNLLDYIEVSSLGNKLTIGLKWGYSYQNVNLRAKITMADLYELEFSGGTHGTIEGFSTSHEFILELSGGSSLIGDFMTSGDARFTLSGGSRLIELVGAANNVRISSSGGSQLELSNFPVHNASVNLNGGSLANINLDGRLDADLSGGSHILYVGDPIMGIINMSGGSTVSEKP